MHTAPNLSIGILGMAVYALMFIAALVVTYQHGIGRMFALVYLPSILFLFNIPAKKVIPALPFVSTSTAIGYGAILALVFKPQHLRPLRWNILDTAVVLMLLPLFCSTVSIDGVYEAYRDVADFAFVWLMPYLFARVALLESDSRRRMLKVLCICAIIIAGLAAYEARLVPNATPRFLIRYGLTRILSGGVLFRWGLARAMVTTAQPIDLGNCGLLIGCMILVLTPATGRRWREPLPLAGIIACGGMVFGSISLTAWGGTCVAFVLYYLFSRPKIGGKLVMPVLLFMTVGLIGYTYYALNTPLADEKPQDPAASSQWIRLKIIHDSWDTCATSGWFGYGSTLDTSNIGVGSIDNSYLYFIMQNGWVALVAWIAFAFLIMFKASVALNRATVTSERLPVAAATAGMMATFFAMYTVFYGFLYATLLCVVFGFLSSMHQMLTARLVSTPAGYPTLPAAGYGYGPVRA